VGVNRAPPEQLFLTSYANNNGDLRAFFLWPLSHTSAELVQKPPCVSQGWRRECTFPTFSQLSIKPMSTPAPGTGSTGFGLAPPVLPAFLITGAFIAVAVTLFTWRHFRWQRRESIRRRNALQNHQTSLSNRHVPKLWDVWVNGDVEKGRQSSDWNTVMPLAAAAVPRSAEDVRASTSSPVMKSNDNTPNATTMSTYQVACVVQMPQMVHHKPRQSSDTMTSNNEYAIGVAVCETPGQGSQAKTPATPVGKAVPKKKPVRQSWESAAYLV